MQENVPQFSLEKRNGWRRLSEKYTLGDDDDDGNDSLSVTRIGLLLLLFLLFSVASLLLFTANVSARRFVFFVSVKKFSNGNILQCYTAQLSHVKKDNTQQISTLTSTSITVEWISYLDTSYHHLFCCVFSAKLDSISKYHCTFVRYKWQSLSQQYKMI